mmetsp:Transcript_16825/g.57486  ORF Transcript_16825/g.57486 Transcript_16825/m.57486 type:complete len:255 (+) Transcript_16825:5262-6026(+)
MHRNRRVRAHHDDGAQRRPQRLDPEAHRLARWSPIHDAPPRHARAPWPPYGARSRLSVRSASSRTAASSPMLMPPRLARLGLSCEPSTCMSTGLRWFPSRPARATLLSGLNLAKRGSSTPWSCSFWSRSSSSNLTSVTLGDSKPRDAISSVSSGPGVNSMPAARAARSAIAPTAGMPPSRSSMGDLRAPSRCRRAESAAAKRSTSRTESVTLALLNATSTCPALLGAPRELLSSTCSFAPRLWPTEKAGRADGS